MTRKSAIEKGEVRIDEMGDAQITAQHLGDVGAGFLEHGLLHGEIKVAELARVGRGEVDLVQLEPLVSETVDEAFRFGICEQALDLLGKHCGLVELFSFASLVSAKSGMEHHSA